MTLTVSWAEKYLASQGIKVEQEIVISNEPVRDFTETVRAYTPEGAAWSSSCLIGLSNWGTNSDSLCYYPGEGIVEGEVVVQFGAIADRRFAAANKKIFKKIFIRTRTTKKRFKEIFKGGTLNFSFQETSLGREIRLRKEKATIERKVDFVRKTMRLRANLLHLGFKDSHTTCVGGFKYVTSSYRNFEENGKVFLEIILEKELFLRQEIPSELVHVGASSEDKDKYRVVLSTCLEEGRQQWEQLKKEAKEFLDNLENKVQAKLDMIINA